MSNVTKNLVKRGTPFSSAAINFLVSNAGKRSATSIASQLRRTVKSVRRKAEKLGLSLRVNN